MPLSINIFKAGADLSVEYAGYATSIESVTKLATPGDTYGIVLYDSIAPSVAAPNAWRARCMWLDTTGGAAPVLKAYRIGASPGWFAIAESIASDTITTAMLKSVSVTLAKLSAAGGGVHQLIRVNAAGTGFDFITLADLLATIGNISITQLSNTGVPVSATRFVGTIGGAQGQVYWYTPAEIAAVFESAQIASTVIKPADVLTAGAKFLSSKTGDTTAVYRAIDPDLDLVDNKLSGIKIKDETVNGSKLVNGSVFANKLAAGADSFILSVVAGTPTWVSPTTVAGTVTKFVTSAAVPATMPAVPTVVATPTVLAHTLLQIPTSYRVVFYCQTADASYSIGDEVELWSVSSHVSTDNKTVPFTVSVSSADVTVYRTRVGDSFTFGAKGTGVLSIMTTANWRLRLYATYVA